MSVAMTRAIVRIVVHANWRTWDRLPVITDEIEALLHRVLAAQCSRTKVGLVAFGAATDHVHVVFTMGPTVTLGEVIKSLKGASGWVLQRESVCSIGWGRGYFAESVSPRDHGALLRYVRNQREHHRRRNTIEHWEPMAEVDDESD